MPDLTGKLILVGEMSREVIWLFGRGLSIGCGLTWNVPEGWRDLGRAEKIKKIGEELRAEMNATNVCTQSIFRFLEFLDRRTRVDWRHLFLTTNWDFLLQREVFRSIPDSFRPAWLSNGHVFHLNGSVETLVDDPWRSPLLLPEDSYKQRTLSPEANKAYNKMIWGTIFVVVGYPSNAKRTVSCFMP